MPDATIQQAIRTFSQFVQGFAFVTAAYQQAQPTQTPIERTNMTDKHLAPTARHPTQIAGNCPTCGKTLQPTPDAIREAVVWWLRQPVIVEPVGEWLMRFKMAWDWIVRPTVAMRVGLIVAASLIQQGEHQKDTQHD